MKLKLTTLSLTFMLSMGLSMTSGHAYSVDPNLSDAQLEKVVKQAEYYVREFEKEVEQQRGGDKAIYRSKKDALDRVQILKQTYPDDPGVEKLFQRTKTALMKSKGDYTEVDPSWTKYKTDEANLRKTIAAKGEPYPPPHLLTRLSLRSFQSLILKKSVSRSSRIHMLCLRMLNIRPTSSTADPVNISGTASLPPDIISFSLTDATGWDRMRQSNATAVWWIHHWLT